MCTTTKPNSRARRLGGCSIRVRKRRKGLCGCPRRAGRDSKQILEVGMTAKISVLSFLCWDSSCPYRGRREIHYEEASTVPLPPQRTHVSEDCGRVQHWAAKNKERTLSARAGNGRLKDDGQRVSVLSFLCWRFLLLRRTVVVVGRIMMDSFSPGLLHPALDLELCHCHKAGRQQ